MIDKQKARNDKIVAANLAHAKFLKARVNDSITVANYVKFINNPGGTK